MFNKLDAKAYRLSNLTMEMIDKNYHKLTWADKYGEAHITIIHQQIDESIYYLDFGCDENLIEALIKLNSSEYKSYLYSDLLELYRHELQHMYQYLYEGNNLNEANQDMFSRSEIDAYLYGIRLKSNYLNQNIIEMINYHIDKYCVSEEIDLNSMKNLWLNRANQLFFAT